MLTTPEKLEDDYSAKFGAARRTLKPRDGVSYVEFLQGLKPKFGRVYRDITLGYILLFGALLTLTFVSSTLSFYSVLAAGFGAIWIGFWFAYLQLFIHEAAHFNLAEDPEKSDRLANLLIGWMIATSVADYRVVHFQHHRKLGRTEDSENTYFSPLNMGFIFKSLFGIRVLEVLYNRGKLIDTASERKAQKQKASEKSAKVKPFPMTRLLGLIAHIVIIAILVLLQKWVALAAWVVGVGVIFPFFGALRQLLEHRSETADSVTDYSAQDHGALTRNFGDDVFSRTFGGAGFNKHLLHHWEPTVSYTNYDELEAYFAESELQSTLTARQSSYFKTFLTLIQKSS